MTKRPIIALLTDFGTADWFVGSMKAAILSRMPDCAIVDLCHSIEPGEVIAAAWLLEKTCGDFPQGTVFCCVVDPGVGTERHAIAVEAGGYFFIAPDNGLLSGPLGLAQEARCRSIQNAAWMREAPSMTFHGRDIFAPAAAQVALDGGIENAGETLEKPHLVELPTTTIRSDGIIEGRIVRFDRFGNAITSIERAALDPPGDDAEQTGDAAIGWRVEAAGLTIPKISATYGDVASGEVLAYWGSLSTLELAIRGGSARKQLALAVNTVVRLASC